MDNQYQELRILLQNMQTQIENISGKVDGFENRIKELDECINIIAINNIERRDEEKRRKQEEETLWQWDNVQTQYVYLFLQSHDDLREFISNFKNKLKHHELNEKDAEEIFKSIQTECKDTFPAYRTEVTNSRGRKITIGAIIGEFLEKFKSADGLKKHLFSHAKTFGWINQFDKLFTDCLDAFVNFLTKNIEFKHIFKADLPRIIYFPHLFEPIKFLGSGGQGDVFECFHTNELKHYAIKKVPTYENDRLSEILEEVSMLSKLGNNNPYIIKYYGIFISDRHSIGHVLNIMDGLKTNGSNSKSSSSSIPNHSNIQIKQTLENDSQDDLIVFEDSGVPAPPKEISLIIDKRSTNTTNAEQNSNFDLSKNSISHNISNYIFIQLELCSPKTLENWLRDHPSQDSRLLKKLRYMFQQMISAVIYYQNFGIIHADLKTKNIFISYENEDDIRIGDFGMAINFKEGEASITNYGTDRLALIRIFTKMLFVESGKEEVVFSAVQNSDFDSIKDYISDIEIDLFKHMKSEDPMCPTSSKILDDYNNMINDLH